MATSKQEGTRADTSERVSLGFGGLQASRGDHVAHFYETNEQGTNILVSYLKAGLKAGEKCVYFTNPGPGRQQLEEALAAVGVDVEAAFTSRRLVLEEGLRPEDLPNFLPVKRIGRPDEIAKAVAILIDNGFVNGASLVVDGGHRLI